VGWSLRRIAREVDAALSSVSVWTRDLAPDGPPTVEQPATPVDEPELRCARCSQMRPQSSFNRLRDGHQAWCRDCFAAYYAEDKARHRRRNDALKARRVAAARAHVVDHLRDHGCVDCGERCIIVLDFDHVGAKRIEVSTLVQRGVRLERIVREIEQCEVVCANCHRRRTARRSGWRRLDPDGSATPWRSAVEERNARFLYRILRASGCIDCGEQDLVVLDFDHVGAKCGLVTKLARGGVSIARLQSEVAQCVVRCVNCHRRRTATALGHYRTKVPPARVELALPP
jgi:hypothetical protein